MNSSIVITWANSSCKDTRFMVCRTSGSIKWPSKLGRAKLAIASEISDVLNPKLAAMRVVVDTQCGKVKPAITNLSILLSLKYLSKFVLMKALLTIFWKTGSLGYGWKPSLKSWPWDSWKRDWVFVYTCWTWSTGHPLSLKKIKQFLWIHFKLRVITFSPWTIIKG